MTSKNVQEMCLIFVLTMLTYSPSLTADFTFDDRPAILENKDVTEDFTLSNLTQYLHQINQHDFWGANITDHSTSHKSYRPFTTLTFALDNFIQKQFFQVTKPEGTLSPFLFHANNIILHGLNSVLFYAFLDQNLKLSTPTTLQMTRKTLVSIRTAPSICFISTIIFAIHPVHTESIAGAVGRADLLYSLFVLLAILIHGYMSLPYNLIVVGILSILSVLSKEQGIILLPLLIMQHVFIKPMPTKGGTKMNILMHSINQTNWKIILLYACGTLSIVYGRLWVMDFRAPTFQEGDNPTAFINSLLLRFLNYSYIYWINLWLLLSPNWLCFDWSMGCLNYIHHFDFSTIFTSQPIFKVLVVSMFWIIIVCISLRAIIDLFNPKHKKILKIFLNDNENGPGSVIVFHAIAFLILPFIPASNIFFTVGFVIAERNLYLSVCGFALLVATGYHKILRNLEETSLTTKPKFRVKINQLAKATKYFFNVLIALFICKSIQRSYEWKNEDVLYRSGLKVCPKNSKIHYNLAKLIQQSQENKYVNIKRQRISNSDVENLMKTTSFDWKADIKELRLDTKSSDYIFLNSESFVVMLYRTSIHLWPNYEHALNNLANVLRKRSEKYFHLEAKTLLTRALKINSKFSAAWMNLGIVQAQLNELKLAEASYLNAVSLRNNFYPDGHFNLGTLYLKLENRKEDALYEFSICISQNEHHFSAWSNKVILLDELNRLPEARIAAERAKTIFPEKAEFYFHLGNILGKQGDFQVAEINYHQAINIINTENLPMHTKIKSLYYSNLGVLYHRWKKEDEAIKNYREALIHDTKNANARDNLNRLLKAQ